ncbi:MAG: sterol desaturase family protein [Leptospiraceae bacterium]|nr:sterol desaturase family protein [Leptospiraceae bacterium]
MITELFNLSGKYLQYLTQEIANPAWNSYFYWLIALSIFFFLWEKWFPWNRQQSVFTKDFWLDVFYMFFNLFLFPLLGFYAASYMVDRVFQNFLQNVLGVENLVAVEIQSWPAWLQLVVLFVVRDFVQWNVHRLLHRSRFLWQFHKVHHSAKQLGFATHLRFHWMENIVYRMFEYIPLGMIGFGVKDFFIVYIISLGIGHFNHSNIRLPLGPLKYIFNNPQMHKWHHVKNLPAGFQYGINYGLSLSIWDYLFKTASIPYDGENIELGYPDDAEMPAGFLGQSVFPISKKE